MCKKKIVILGPESTGKSTIAKQLADHLDEPWVAEYAREYIDTLNRPYEKKDLLTIAKGQVELEDRNSDNSNRFLFCDTNLIVIKVWSEFKYGTVDPWIMDMLRTRKYDYYLLMDIDLPWEEDPQREHPEKREELFSLYQSYLIENSLPYEVVSGKGEHRFQTALSIIESQFD